MAKKPENKKVTDGSGLNFRQKMFCDWYIKLGGSLKGGEAAIRAGYSEKTAYSIASELLKNPKIDAYLEKRKHNLEELLGFNKSTMLGKLHKITDMSMKAVPVMEWDRETRQMVQVTEVNDKGKEVGVFEYDSNGANRAIENINKMMGYNEPEKVEDVTPLDKKKPAVVVINKNYEHPESHQSTD